MTRSDSLLVLLAASMLLGGCWGEVKDIFPDGGPPPTDTGDPPAEAEFIDGGGIGGDPIDGRISIFVLEEVTGVPLENVKVQVVYGGGDEVVATTDSDGLAILDAEGMEGPVDVHMFSPDYVVESVLAVDACNGTFELRPLGGPQQADPAVISGSVQGFDILAEPASDEYRIAYVFFSQAISGTMNYRDPGFRKRGEAFAEVLPGLGDDTFEMEVPPAKGQLYVLGGLMRTFGTTDTSDDAVDWTHIGTVGEVEPDPGETMADVEVAIEMAMLIKMRINVTIADSFERKEAFVGLDFGADGAMWFEYDPNTSIFTFALPNYYGIYAEGDVVVGTHAGQDHEGEVDDPLAHMPQLYVFDRGLDTYDEYEVDPYELGVGSGPPMPLAWDGEVFQILPTSDFTFNHVVMSEWDGAEKGNELWRVLHLGDIPGAGVSQPSFPSDWGWDGVPESGVHVSVWGSKLGGNLDEIHFMDYAARIEQMAMNEAIYD